MAIVTAVCNKGSQWRFDNNTLTASPIAGSGSAYLICNQDGFTQIYVIAVDFNWPALPVGSTIIRATVEFYMTQGLPSYNTGGSPVDIGLNEVTASWTEGQANYPTFDLLSSLPTGTASNLTYVSRDITSYVRARYNGTTKHGLVVGNNILRDSYLAFEGYHVDSNRPQVHITYEERFLQMMV